MDIDLITRIITALERESVAYKVFGGIALNAHGVARGTQDRDVFIEPSQDNVERLRRALTSIFHDPSIAEITSDDLSGPYPAIQYVPPSGSFSIDILSRLGNAYAFADLETVRTTWNGVPMTAVSPRQLYEMKRNTVRPQDRADAQRLREHFGWDEEA